ncbi:MAG: hypothetical protein AAFN09_12005 [Pseudomonadota bacterium]
MDWLFVAVEVAGLLKFNGSRSVAAYSALVKAAICIMAIGGSDGIELPAHFFKEFPHRWGEISGLVDQGDFPVRSLFLIRDLADRDLIF